MDLEDRVSLIKLRIAKLRKKHDLYDTPPEPPKIVEKKNDYESDTEKLREKFKVQRVR